MGEGGLEDAVVEDEVGYVNGMGWMEEWKVWVEEEEVVVVVWRGRRKRRLAVLDWII